MPSTTQDRIQFHCASSDLYGAGGEPLGEPPAPPSRSSQTSRGLSGELIEEALDRARLRSIVSELSQERRHELIEAVLDELAEGREQLPEVLNERLLNGMLDELIAGKRGEREILGSDGVLGELTRRLIERALGEELSEHLGYRAGQAPVGGVGNSRNGGTPKTVLTANGPVAIAVSARSQEPL
jgi:hypothetical protein